MAERPAARAGAALKVAIVDDSFSVFKAIERMLAPRGFAAVWLRSGGEALRRLEPERPDLVICDLVLPDVDGLEVCRFVRRSAPLARVPLIAISGLAGEASRRQAVEAGADAVLEKPFRGDALLARIEALAGAHRPPVAAPPRPAAPLAAPGEPPTAGAVLAELERLAGIRAGRWRLADGRAGRLRGAPAAAAPDPDAALAGLLNLAGRLGVGAPRLALLEGGPGELLLVGHRAGRGTVVLALADGSALGRARHLVGKFLSLIPIHCDRKEPVPCRP